jgi:MerR family copper efflux transcriptional regulator
MRIGELARRTGIPTKTIRFWESQGLLPAPSRTAGGYRDYQLTDAERLAFIRRSQLAGFRLHDIRQVLTIVDAGEPACQHVAAVIDERLRDVDARIAELRRARKHLRELAKRAAAQDPADCRGYCTILTTSRRNDSRSSTSSRSTGH